MDRGPRSRRRRCAAVVVAATLLAVVLPLLAAPDPAFAPVNWDEGVASAADVDGRLVAVWVEGFEGSGFSPPNILMTARQLCPGCGWETAASPIGLGWKGAPSLSLAADGRLEVIGWGGSSAPATVRVLSESCPGCGWPPVTDFSGPGYGEDLPRQLPVDPPQTNRRLGVAVATNPDGRRELFTTAADGQMWHTWEWSGGGWAEWAPLGAPPADPFVGAPAPAAAANADGRLEVFARTASGRLVHSWQWCGGGCGWSPWVVADGGPVADTSPGLARNADGRLEVFAGVDDVLQHSWQVCAGCGWSPWVPVDGDPPLPASFVYPGFSEATAHPPGPAAAGNADGRLEVFTQPTPYEPVTHVWQVCAGCWWGPTVPLG